MSYMHVFLFFLLFIVINLHNRFILSLLSIWNHEWIQKVLPEGVNSDNVFFLFFVLFVFFRFFMRGKRIQIALKADYHRPASEMPLNGVSLAGR